MMASPAEIENDMILWARNLRKSERQLADTCLRAASVMKRFRLGESVDGRTYYGLHQRLLDQEGRCARDDSLPDLIRARLALEGMKRARSGSK